MSLIQRLAETFSDSTLPILYKDGLINLGSLYCFDFCDPNSNANAAGTLTSSSPQDIFTNLVPSGANGQVIGLTNILTNLASNAGITVPGSGNTTGITLGANGTYDLHVSNHEFLVIAWIKTPTTGYISTAYVPFFELSTGNNNVAQFAFDNGADGKTPRVNVGAGSSAGTVAAASGFGLGAPTQLALHWKSTGLVELYGNGALISSIANGPTTLQSAATVTPIFANNWKGTLYRLYEEDLTVSGASAAAQVALDYAYNSARFV